MTPYPHRCKTVPVPASTSSTSTTATPGTNPSSTSMYTAAAATTPALSPRSNASKLVDFDPGRFLSSDALPLPVPVPVPSHPSEPSTERKNPRAESLTTQKFISDAFGRGFLPENPVFGHLVGTLAWWHIANPPAAVRVGFGGVGRICVAVPRLGGGVAIGMGTNADTEMHMKMKMKKDGVSEKHGDSDISCVIGSEWEKEKRRSWDARRYGLLGVFEFEGRSKLL